MDLCQLVFRLPDQIHLGLYAERHAADFVQEYRTAVCLFNLSHTPVGCTGEGPLSGSLSPRMVILSLSLNPRDNRPYEIFLT